jgi:RNA polymerase sigma-70 factor, ECF subfamily
MRPYDNSMPPFKPDWNSLYNDLTRYVVSKVKDTALAHDIVQEVLLKGYERLNQLRKPERFAGWIFQIARNEVAEYFRRNAKFIDHPGFNDEPSSQDYNECASRCLFTLMQSLPAKYREALEFTSLETNSQADLALLLGISHAGARSRVQRARKMLKKRMEDLFIIRSDPYGNIIHCENRTPCCCESGEVASIPTLDRL